MSIIDTEHPQDHARPPPMRLSLLEITLVVTNLALMFLMWHQLDKFSRTRSINVAQYVEANEETTELLAACFIPEGGYRIQSDDSRPYQVPQPPGQ